MTQAMGLSATSTNLGALHLLRALEWEPRA